MAVWRSVAAWPLHSQAAGSFTSKLMGLGVFLAQESQAASRDTKLALAQRETFLFRSGPKGARALGANSLPGLSGVLWLSGSQGLETLKARGSWR